MISNLLKFYDLPNYKPNRILLQQILPIVLHTYYTIPTNLIQTYDLQDYDQHMQNLLPNGI